MTKILLSLGLLAFTVTAAFAQNPAPPPSRVEADGRVTFSYRAPADVKEVTLRGQWKNAPIAMAKGERGDWSVTLEGVPAGVWEYSFDLGGVPTIDPRNPYFKPQRSPEKSILHVPSNPPAPWDWQDVPHGTVHTHDYTSKVLGRQRQVIVYTPPGYEIEAAKKYPLLVLQHGSGDDQRTWIAHGKANWIFDNLIAQKKAVPMVVMMIDGHPLGLGAQNYRVEGVANAMDAFQKELFEDALPIVEKLYRVEKDPAQRGICGLSMGGDQALTTGIAFRDRFAWVGVFSANTFNAEDSKKYLSDADSINKSLRLLWIAIGREDMPKFPRNETFVAFLKEKGIKHTYEVSDGGHWWPIWRKHLSEFTPLIFQAAN